MTAELSDFIRQAFASAQVAFFLGVIALSLVWLVFGRELLRNKKKTNKS